VAQVSVGGFSSGEGQEAGGGLLPGNVWSTPEEDVEVLGIHDLQVTSWSQPGAHMEEGCLSSTSCDHAMVTTGGVELQI